MLNSSQASAHAYSEDADAATSAKLEVTRKKAFMAKLRKMAVLVDGREAGTLASGETVVVPVPPGTHAVSARMGSVSSAPSRVEFPAGGTVRLGIQLKAGLWAMGDLLLTREDGTALVGDAGPAGHHGKVIVVLGLVGFLIGLVGLAALGQGIVDLRKMAQGKMDSSGRTLTLVGAILGGIGFALNLLGFILSVTGG